MRIRTIDTFPDELDDIARRSREGTFYQSGTWINSLIEAYPRLTFRCLVAEDNGDPLGYFPFFFAKRGPFRAAWSMPFGTYGGPVTLSEETTEPLLQAYTKVLSRPGVVKVGWIDFSGAGKRPGWDAQRCETHIVDISAGFDSLWTEQMDRQRKKRTRRAKRLGVTIRPMRSAEDIRRYYAVYCDRIERWGGGEKYPEKLFLELLERGGDSVRLYLAFCGDEFLGGHVNFYFKDMVTSWNGVTSIESNHLQPATLLYVHCMREACEQGFRLYNLGGSLEKQSLIDFKESLGGVPRHYAHHVRQSLLGKIAAHVKRIGG